MAGPAFGVVRTRRPSVAILRLEKRLFGTSLWRVPCIDRTLPKKRNQTFMTMTKRYDQTLRANFRKAPWGGECRERPDLDLGAEKAVLKINLRNTSLS